MNEELKDFLDKKLNKERPEPLQPPKPKAEPFSLYAVMLTLVAIFNGIVYRSTDNPIFMYLMLGCLAVAAFFMGRHINQMNNLK